MPTADRIKFGKTVRALRLARNWTQEELASRSKLHLTYIGGIERGERNPGLESILKIARALSEHPSALFVK